MNAKPRFEIDAIAKPSASHIAMMVTRRCNMTCAHCSVQSSPHVNSGPDEEELLRRVQQAAAANVRSILFTGGEPMTREAVVLRLMHAAKLLGMSSGMTTNGSWGRTPEGAQRRLKALRHAGLQRLTVSYDRYHAEFQGPEPALNIALAAEELNFPINIGITRVADDADLEQIVAPFRELRGVRMRFYDVQPLGSAKNFPRESLRDENEGFCSACIAPAITDDGRVTACNGPSYFLDSSSPLVIGSLSESSMGELIQIHQQDPVLETIRTLGPGRLRDELKTIPGFSDFPFRDHYHGMCELCQHVTGDPAAVEALRERLVEPQQTAHRAAMRRVMDDNKRSGALNRNYVNSIGTCRAVYRATGDVANPWPPESRKVLGRADVDWNELAHYLTICGLARPLLPALNDAEIRRWAPNFFLDGIQQRAIADGVRELIRREILRRLSGVLTEVGTHGVLLKGGAMLALSSADVSGAGSIGRSSSDIDVYVRPDRAIEVRARLLQAGFEGSPVHELPYRPHHHLAPVMFQNVPVEIHTRIAPAVWQLPEREMLEQAIPLPDENFAGLSTLDAEGMLLHTVVHVTHHSFAFGLKTAWDIRWLLRHFDGLDWDRLANWADRSRTRRAFWVPLRIMCQEMEIPLPPDFLNRAPSDARQRRLELIARKRLFSSREVRGETNNAGRIALILLMQDSWLDRLRHLTRIGCGFGFRFLRTPRASSARLRQYFKQSISQWGQYRRAIAGAKSQREKRAQ